jgi:hypothetical protein
MRPANTGAVPKRRLFGDLTGTASPDLNRVAAATDEDITCQTGAPIAAHYHAAPVSCCGASLLCPFAHELGHLASQLESEQALALICYYL